MTSSNAIQIQSVTAKHKSDYWNSFYSLAAQHRDGALPLAPSQFAAMAVTDLKFPAAIIEFGCGNGRDSEFFGQFGIKVLALDASEAGIALAKKRSVCPFVEYRHVTSLNNCDLVADFISALSEGVSVAVYARFFLHAITAEEEEDFISLLSTSIPSGSLAFLEYRTEEDRLARKEFGMHYRRFINHGETLDRYRAAGFELVYEIESRGLARFKREDAAVGRCILRKL